LDRPLVRDTAGMDTQPTDGPTVIRRDDLGRYELSVDGEVIAFASFSRAGDVVMIPHIETAVQHRGNGYSSMLMDGVIEDLRASGLQVRATCSVARAHLAGRAAELLVR
jgi:predicted GNAT family acetyltransferase